MCAILCTCSDSPKDFYLISEQNREQNLEHWSETFMNLSHVLVSTHKQTSSSLTDRSGTFLATVLNTQSQLCHRAATRSYSAVIVSIHRHWVQRAVDVTSQDSSRSHQSMELSGWISNKWIYHCDFVLHTEYTTTIIVLRVHNALYWWLHGVGKFCWLNAIEPSPLCFNDKHATLQSKIPFNLSLI